MQTSLNSNWTEEYRLTCVKWTRGMAVFYGCIAFLVFGLMVLTKPSSIAPNEASDQQTWSIGLEGEGTNHNADMSWKT